MKKIISLTLFLFLIKTVTAQTAYLNVTPQQAKAGETIRFEYTLAGSPLEKAKEAIEVVAVEYVADQPQTIPVLSRQSGGKITGQFTLSAEAKVGMLAFQAGERWDNNQGEGYFIALHDAAGTALPQSLAAQAVVYRNWGSLYELNRKATVAYDMFNKAFARNAAILPEFCSAYVNCITSAKRGDEGQKEALAVLNKILETPNLTENQKIDVAGMLDRLSASEKANQLRESIAKEYPKGNYVRQKSRRDMRVYREVAEVEKAIAQYQKDFAGIDGLEDEISELYLLLGSKAAEAQNWEVLKKAAVKMTPANRASLYNNTAWGLAEDGADLEMARQMAAEATEWAMQEMQNPQAEKPGYFSEKRWEENRKYTFAQYADTYAYVLDKLNDPENAARYQGQAVDATNGEELEMNERYTEYLEKTNAPDLRYRLEGFILKGQASAKMKDQFKKLYASEDKSTAGTEAYMAGLEKTAKANRKKAIAAKMLDQPAPAFQLKNLDGEEVSLASLKGKVVVVDFWATWCGPCKASFPGMQQAQNNHKDDPNVAFVFIDSWERVDDKAKAASEFIQSKGYTFNVLLDLDDSVISSYGVTGIPTKFVLDRSGKIRFKSIGYAGSSEALVDELTAMIELAKAQP